MPADTFQTEFSLAQRLQRWPSTWAYRWHEEARWDLLETLFLSLAHDDTQQLRYFFPNGPPHKGALQTQRQPWKLSDAQGATEGAEYSAAARGKRCGHILKLWEPTYHCKTCSIDDTCVLCGTCFEASNHEGHQVSVSYSSGSGGCCDCGDEEAWVRTVPCSIHSPRTEDGPTSQSKGKGKLPGVELPQELKNSIRSTIATALDYICDVFSCAPDHIRLPPKERSSTLLQNEEFSRLQGPWYYRTNDTDRPEVGERCEEFALVLWNDEKHTVDEVVDQLSKACRIRKKSAELMAAEVDKRGRCVVEYLKDPEQLLHRARILEQIKITVTVRSSRDVVREEMCGTIVEWLRDIAGCTCGPDDSILLETICAEMLKPWRAGSSACNIQAGKRILDESSTENRLHERRNRQFWAHIRQTRPIRRPTQPTVGNAHRTIPEQLLQILVNPNGTATGVQPTEGQGLDENPIDENETNELNENDFNADEDDMADEMDLDEALANVHPDDDDVEMDLEETGGLGDIATPGLPGVFENVEAHSTTSLARSRGSERTTDDEYPDFRPATDVDQLMSDIPRTRQYREDQTATSRHHRPPPDYWTHASHRRKTDQPFEVHENLEKRVRIDFLILYDLRFWKNLRDDFRNLYISTVVMVPYFKRVLALRFSSVYTHLAQLYLIADREPEHSIINLSVQMLTTASIIGEVADRANFFTKLLAILYTFLTKHQVGFPEDVDPDAIATFEYGHNGLRRVSHLFMDMRHLLCSKTFQERIREREDFLLQYLDFVTLYQGICPNVRAVLKHVEYENDAWQAANSIVQDVARISPQFCESFKWSRGQDFSSTQRAIRQTARAATIHSLGLDPRRTKRSQSEQNVAFLLLPSYDDELDEPGRATVDYKVSSQPISTHNVLHYNLSWLIEYSKGMDPSQLRHLLSFEYEELRLEQRGNDQHTTPALNISTPQSRQTANLEPKPVWCMLSLFDMPLRVCVWLSQIRAGMWVRNGQSVRQQMAAYRSVSHRDTSAQRDIFMLQVASVVLPHQEFLANMIERFEMSKWVQGEEHKINNGWEDGQMIDVFEDFLHLLIVILSDRSLLIPLEDEPDQGIQNVKQDIAHVLCFKPLSHSALSDRVSANLLENPGILRECANYRAPEGLQDNGTFELKDECFDQVDPFNSYYNKNQREDAESIWRSRMAKRTGAKVEDVVYEPRLKQIKSGLFASLGNISQCFLFAQIIQASLDVALNMNRPSIPKSRIDALLPVLLHVTLIAIAEDRQNQTIDQERPSFCKVALTNPRRATIFRLLMTLLSGEEHDAAKPRMRLIVQRLQEKEPRDFEQAVARLPNDIRPKSGDLGVIERTKESAELKKKMALERQARVMAGFKQQQTAFMQNNAIDWGDDEDEPDADADMFGVDKKTWSFPQGICILCQEETSASNKLYGSPTLLTETTIHRTTDLTDRDWVREVGMVPESLDRSAESIRPFGVAGVTSPPLRAASKTWTSALGQSAATGKGYPASLERTGPIATGCGHVMHFQCFETYRAATHRRHQLAITRDYPETPSTREFLCPLCKALGNTFMPIIWRPKDWVPADKLLTNSYDQWITAQMPYLVSRVIDGQQYQRVAQSYSAESFANTFASKLSLTSHSGASSHGAVFRQDHGSALQNLFARRGQNVAQSSTTSSEPTDAATAELALAYRRIHDVISANELYEVEKDNENGTFLYTDTLATTFGYSVGTTEVAYRGVGRNDVSSLDTNTFIMDTIPEQTLIQLKVLSETVTSYLAVHTLSNAVERQEVPPKATAQILALLGPSGSNLGRFGDTYESTMPLLRHDVFVFFAECTVYMVPYMYLNLQSILRLCYLAEIVKVLVAFFKSGRTPWDCANLDLNGNEFPCKMSQAEGERWTAFVQCILYRYNGSYVVGEGSSQRPGWLDENPNNRYSYDRFLHTVVCSYALTFLRKATLLLSVRYNVDFSQSASAIDPDLPELTRLTRLLQLPSIDELVSSAIGPTPSGKATHRILDHWLTHYLKPYKKSDSSDNNNLDFLGSFLVELPHPGIFELVPLPPVHDILNTAVVTARCPTTGGPVNEPTLCLLCGALLCAQSSCCATETPPGSGRTQGACHRHMKTCGGPIGIFLLIRKCAILFRHGMHGCYERAPYLDANGECDMRRRALRLWLDRRRYDKGIRDVWLKGMVPTVVARRGDGEIGVGGWETI
ncbi:MAG: hypothetical protein M1828_006880 [Chrysothrix sp. TS-e1954]|nr:MAG: hypothetical protein M1828_006880 [Chrysothrix sp. TS-e1954]